MRAVDESPAEQMLPGGTGEMASGDAAGDPPLSSHWLELLRAERVALPKLRRLVAAGELPRRLNLSFGRRPQAMPFAVGAAHACAMRCSAQWLVPRCRLLALELCGASWALSCSLIEAAAFRSPTSYVARRMLGG